MTLTLLCYFEEGEYGFVLGFWDNRDFWMTAEERLMTTPYRWCPINEP